MPDQALVEAQVELFLILHFGELVTEMTLIDGYDIARQN
jgi:hypothetical protein